MSKKRIIRKSIAGVLALTMMAPAVLPSGEFVMNILDSSVLRAAAEQQEQLKIGNNGCPWFDFGFAAKQFGESLNFNIDLNQSASNICILKSESKDGTYTQVDNAVEVTETAVSIPVTIEEGYWYKFDVTFEDGSVESTVPITFMRIYDRGSIYMYVTNTYMAYTSISSSSINVIGKNYAGTGWISTSYSGSWELITNPGGSIKCLKASFDSNKNEKIDFEAFLKETQTGFSLGCDVMIGGSDAAPVTAVRDTKGRILQTQLVNTNGLLADITETDDSVVLNTEKRMPSSYWIGYYWLREHFKFNTLNDVIESGETYGNYSYDQKNVCYQVQKLDSGMTVSWDNVPAGDTVPFSFLIGPVSATGAKNTALCDSFANSDKITVKDGKAGNWYKLQKKDETLTDTHVVYNAETGNYEVSDNEQDPVWVQLEEDCEFCFEGLIPETDYLLTVLSAEAKQAMDEGETVEPLELEMTTLIDPYISEDNSDPVKMTVTSDSVKFENLRNDYSYSLFNCTEYKTPVDGTVEFTNLKSDTEYMLVASSNANNELDSDVIIIRTMSEITFTDKYNNFSKKYCVNIGDSYEDLDLSEIDNYADKLSDSTTVFIGWFDENGNEYKNDEIVEGSKNYYAGYRFTLSCLSENEDGYIGKFFDLANLCMKNDTGYDATIIVENMMGPECSTDLCDQSESYVNIDCSSRFVPDSWVYLGENDNCYYFAPVFDNSTLGEELMINNQSPYYQAVGAYSSELAQELDNGKTIIQDIDPDYNFYALGDYIAVCDIYNTDTLAKNRLKRDSIWSIEHEDDKIILSKSIPFDIILCQSSLYNYIENGNIVRECQSSEYFSWIKIDDIYDGEEMVLFAVVPVIFFDENEQMIKTVGAVSGEPLPKSVFEEVNSKYSNDKSFIGWYSEYEDEIVSESRVIEFNDYYYPVFGIVASKFDDNAIGTIVNPKEYYTLYNDTDDKITIWVDGEAYDLEPNESYSYDYYDSSFISSISNGLYFAGSKDNNYYFASILPNSILSEGNEVIIENDGKKYLNVFDNNEISLVGLGDSFIAIYSDYNIDYQDALFSLKTKTWSYQRTYNGSGIIEGTNLPFDGLISDSQINIIDNNEIVDSSDKITITDEDVSYECNVILLDKNNPDPVVFRKVLTGLDISQVEGIMEVEYVAGNPNYISDEGVIEVTSGDKFIIYAAEEIDFDEIFGGIASVSSQHVKTGDDKGYYYTIEITDDVDPDATYYATHKHDYSYITDTNGTGADDAETATLRYKCNSEEGSDYVTIARLGLGSTLYYGDSLVPKVELLPENLNLGEKIAKGSVTYKAGDNVSSAAPTDFGVYNVAAEIVMTNLDDTITKYSLSKNVSYEKRPLSECKVVVSQETYDGTEKIPASIKVINPANNEELVLNKDYVIDPITPKKEAGTYQDGIVLHAVADSENYTGDYSVTWSINKADLSDFSINALDRYTYGSGYEIGVSSLPEDADGEVTYSYSYDGEDWFDEEPKDVGTYYVKAEYSNDNNYNDAETDVFSYTIEKKNIVVTPVAAEMTYGDTELPLITCTISEIPDILEGNEPSAEELATLVEVKGFSVDGTAEGTSNNAGKYNIGLINGVEDELDNYTFVLDSTPVYMTVKPRKITADMFRLISEDFTEDSYNFEYDGKRKKVEYAINANDEDGNYHVANTYAVLTPDDFEQGGTVYATKAGEYKVEFIGNNELYGEGNWCGFQTVEWNISKRNVNVKIQAANGAEVDKEYDGTPVAFEVVSTDPAKPLSDAATITYSYFEITDGEEGEEIEAPTAAGSYRVKATVNDENTSIPEGISLDYVIKAKDVTVNIDASTTTKVYGDETPDICYTFDGIIDADKEKYASDTTGNVTADLTSENVGSYGLTSDFTDKNYNFTLSKSTFEITRREILESDVAISSNKVFIPDSGWTNPTVTVTSNGNTLKMDEDFICSGTFKTRIKGEKSFLVEGTGNYKGEVEVNWTAVSLDDLSIQMTNAEPVYADGNYKVKYRFEMPELPEGLTVVKYGALYNKNGSLEENAKIEDNSILRTTKTTAYPSSYSLTINNNNDMSARSSAKCYAVVTDGENEYVIYSNVVGACYKDKVAAYCGSITAEPTSIAKVDNQYKVSFKFDFEIPENFTVTEYGALYNKNGVIGEDLTYETAANKTSKAATSKINSYTLTVNEKSAVDAVASARCYAKVTDGTNEFIIYSGVVSDSFSAAAQREAEEKCSVTGTCVTEVKQTTSNPYKENFTFNLNAGEGYTITARGALYDKTLKLTGSERVESFGNVIGKVGSETTYTLAMGYSEMNEATGSAMGYMEVTDSYDLTHIIYSDPVDCVQFDN